MIKTIFALTVLLATTQVEAASDLAQIRTPASTDVVVVVEALTPLENAFDVACIGGRVFHLDNAARMSMAKMNALNASLDNKVAVKLRVQGKEIIDIILD